MIKYKPEKGNVIQYHLVRVKIPGASIQSWYFVRKFAGLPVSRELRLRAGII